MTAVTTRLHGSVSFLIGQRRPSPLARPPARSPGVRPMSTLLLLTNALQPSVEVLPGLALLATR